MKKNSLFALKHSRGFVRTGILILFAAVLAVAFFLNRGLGTVRWGMAECLRWQGMILSERFILQDQEYAKLEGLIEEYANKIEVGSISPEKGFPVLRALYKGPVLLAMLNSSVNKQFQLLQVPSLHACETISLQFFLGQSLGKVSQPDCEKVKSMLMEDKISETVTSNGLVIPESIESFKKEIGFDSLLNCLEIMNKANQNAGFIAGDKRLDSVEELRKVFDKVCLGAYR